jgi:hypothetical protein
MNGITKVHELADLLYCKVAVGGESVKLDFPEMKWYPLDSVHVDVPVRFKPEVLYGRTQLGSLPIVVVLKVLGNLGLGVRSGSRGVTAVAFDLQEVGDLSEALSPEEAWVNVCAVARETREYDGRHEWKQPSSNS